MADTPKPARVMLVPNHIVPPVYTAEAAREGMTTNDFTDLEVDIILGLCRGKGRTLPNTEIAEWLGISVGMVMVCQESIHDKTGLMSRFELFDFIKTALNGELRRRKEGESCVGPKQT